jgi:4-hydroxy-3-methylbut-2-enyl diphosphate reductase
MIHNPQVNATLVAKGVQFLQDTYGRQVIPFEELDKEDVVIIPAFGTTLEIESLLRKKGIAVEKYNTTCPFVEKVWNRSEQIAAKGYSIVVHGKPKHEETRATFSHTSVNTPTVIVTDMHQTVELGKYITGEKPPQDFYTEFAGLYSENFSVEKDLQRLGVVNQTTQLASDTQAIAEYLKQLVKQHYQLSDATISERFADTRDTLCYATNDNQTAVTGLLETDADLAIVVGGYNSSNTTHLVELCEQKLPVYFINGTNELISSTEIKHFNIHDKQVYVTRDYLPSHRPARILITSGASCPDSVVEEVMEKLASFFNTEQNISDQIHLFQ